MYVCSYICVSTHAHNMYVPSAFMYVCMYVFMYVCMYVCICMCVCPYEPMCLGMHACMCRCACTYELTDGLKHYLTYGRFGSSSCRSSSSSSGSCMITDDC